MRSKIAVLCILEGWGIAPPSPANLIASAKTSNFDNLVSSYPSMSLVSFGEAVGLASGQASASSVGFLNIGAGLVPHLPLSFINKTIKDGSFFSNKILLEAISHAKQNNGNLHLVGLISREQIQSSMDHVLSLLEMCGNNGFTNVFLHVFLDGIDSQPTKGMDIIEELQNKLNELGFGKIASICGRNFAMDKTRHWEKTEKCYESLVYGKECGYFTDPKEAMKISYEQKIFDQDVNPQILINDRNKPEGLISDNDSVIFFNFRIDGMRQLLGSFTNIHFEKFEAKSFENLYLCSMTNFENDFEINYAFEIPSKYESLLNVISKQSLRILNLTEAQNFGESSFYLNGKQKEQIENVENRIIPNDKKALKKNKLGAKNKKVLKMLNQEILSEKYDFIVVNFSIKDKLLDKKDIKSAIKEIEVVDKALGEIAEVVLSKNGYCFIVSNSSYLEDSNDSGEMKKENSANPVPFIIIGKEFEGRTSELVNTIGSDLSITKPVGVLADVAPTILKVLNIDKPKDMTGTALI